MKHYAVGQKVFETEEEAREFSRDLMNHGALGGWMPTDKEVTHRYCFEGNLRTEEVRA